MSVIKVVLIVAALWSLFVLLLQRRVLYPRWMIRSPAEPQLSERDVQRLWIDAPPGRVEAWLLPALSESDGPAPAVLFAHGNAELIDFWPGEWENYRRMGLAVMLCEYRGYGRSAGSPTQTAIVEDFVKFFDMLGAQPQVDPDRIVVHGRSLGAGAVCALALRRKPAALVLESAFTSVPAMARRMGVPPFLVLDKFNNRSALAELQMPALILHSRADDVVPVRHAQRLHEVAHQGRLVLFDGLGHNDPMSQRTEYWQALEAFLRDSGVLSGPE